MSSSNSSESDTDEEEQCCGSGCNNCVLDKLQQTNKPKFFDIESKSNIFSKNYTKFAVQNILRHSDTIYEFAFSYINTDGNDLTNFIIDIPPGHHLFLRSPYIYNEKTAINRTKHDQNTIEEYISRPYTPILVNRKELQFHILVKLESNGQMSSYLRHLTIGNHTEWKGVYGTFKWITASLNHTKYTNLVCIYQGIAVAPIYSVMSSIFANDLDETRITVFGCYKNIENILMRKKLYEFHQYWNLNSINYYLSQQKCTCSIRQMNCLCIKKHLWYNENVFPYRLDDCQEFDKVFANKIKNQTYTIVCGTDKFTQFIKCMLIEQLMIENENIFIF